MAVSVEEHSALAAVKVLGGDGTACNVLLQELVNRERVSRYLLRCCSLVDQAGILIAKGEDGTRLDAHQRQLLTDQRQEGVYVALSYRFGLTQKAFRNHRATTLGVVDHLHPIAQSAQQFDGIDAYLRV